MAQIKQAVILEVFREVYSPWQVDSCETLTVGELKQALDKFDDDTPLLVSHDNGYTYGRVRESNLLDWIDPDWIESSDEQEERFIAQEMPCHED